MLWSARPQRNHPRTQGKQPLAQCGLHASPHFAHKRQVPHQLPHTLTRRQPGAAHSHANFEAHLQKMAGTGGGSTAQLEPTLLDTRGWTKEPWALRIPVLSWQRNAKEKHTQQCAQAHTAIGLLPTVKIARGSTEPHWVTGW